MAEGTHQIDGDLFVTGMINSGSGGGDGFMETSLTTNDATKQTIVTIPLADDTAFLLEVHVVARRTDAADRAMNGRVAGFFRENPGAAVLIGSREVYTLGNINYELTFDVSGNDGLIQIQDTEGNDVNWTTFHRLRERT